MVKISKIIFFTKISLFFLLCKFIISRFKKQKKAHVCVYIYEFFWASNFRIFQMFVTGSWKWPRLEVTQGKNDLIHTSTRARRMGKHVVSWNGYSIAISYLPTNKWKNCTPSNLFRAYLCGLALTIQLDLVHAQRLFRLLKSFNNSYVL